MILHPGILALFSSSTVVLIAMLVAGWHGLAILVRWNPQSSSESQLALERKSWLISVLLNFALTVQVVSTALFVFTVDDIHRLFIGAMCATGALNANLVGWLVLLLKVALFFLGAIWVVFNRLDQCTEDTPLIRTKYLMVLLLTPLVALDLYSQWLYFSGLQPQVITSCCGSLFSAAGEGVAAGLAGFPVDRAVPMFFGVAGVFLTLLLVTLKWRRPVLRLLLFAASVFFFVVGLGAVVSFISLYIYQMPTHHCPFDMIQGHYHYVGYPLYAGLFGAALFGMLPGLAQPFRTYASLKVRIDEVESGWLVCSLAGLILFLAVACWPMLFGSLRLFGY